MFFGFKVSQNGISPDPIKLRTNDAIKLPTNVSGTRSLLGLFNYFKNHVDRYAEISQFINQLLKKNVEFRLLPECQKALETLKKKLLLEPQLSFPNFEKEFFVNTDASQKVNGAVLFQHDNLM